MWSGFWWHHLLKKKTFCASYRCYSLIIKHYFNLTVILLFVHVFICMSGIKRRGSWCQDVGASRWFVFFPGGPCGDISAIHTFAPSDLLGAALSRRLHRTLGGGRTEAGKQIWMLFKCCLISGNSETQMLNEIIRSVEFKWESGPYINKTTFWRWVSTI